MSHTVPANRLPAICECQAHGFALLSRGAVAFFSPERLPLVAGRMWTLKTTRSGKAAQNYAAYTSPDRRTVMMHREIICAEASMLVDHVDRNGLNNRDENIRLCTISENNRNQRAYLNKAIPFKGVAKAGSGFSARIRQGAGNPPKRIGTFRTPEEAARAYDKAALEAFGEYAMTNAMLGLLPTEEPQP